MSKLESVVRILESQEPEEISVIFRSSTGHHRFDSLVQQISVLADFLSTPLSIGGFSSFQDPSFAAIFKAGADKIIINSLLYTNPDLVRHTVLEYGAQSISAAVDIQLVDGVPMAKSASTDCGSSFLNINQWIQRALEAGVGELQISSIDFDGGHVPEYYLEALLPVFISTGLPVVYGGGCYSTESFCNAFRLGVTGVTASSFFLKKDQNLSEIKAHLHNRNFPVRYNDSQNSLS